MAIIEISNLSKYYPHVANNRQRVRGMVDILLNHSREGGARILHDLSFTVKKGESLAIVGRNGAGKSTLLKILSGVIQPTSGTVKVHGTIGALLELGSGFDPEYTGLDNLKMSAALNGIKGKQAAIKIQRMIEFADIGEYIHEPVKTYSSGMVVRLGFSVITETKPDLLITDEVLAVGDESFQLKCLKWIDEYLHSGGTLLLVSHSIYHVQKICQKAIWIDAGEIKLSGNSFEVSQAYQHEMLSQLPKITNESNEQPLQIKSIEFKAASGKLTQTFDLHADIHIKVTQQAPNGEVPGLCMGIVGYDNQAIYGTFSDIEKIVPKVIGDQLFEYNLTIKSSPLLPGKYHFKFHTMTPDQIQMVDTVAKEITIVGQTRELGVCHIDVDWTD